VRAARILVTAALVVVPLMGLAASPLSAQTATGGFGAAPAHPDPADPATRAYFKEALAPGATTSDEVLVTSNSDAPLQLVISAVDGLTGQTSGSVYANRDAPVRRAGAWITPAVSALSLAPHAQQLVGFQVQVPSDAAPGDHLGGLAIEDANPTRAGGQFAITQVVRTVVGVEVIVPGPASPAVRLGHLALKALPGTQVAALSIGLSDPGRLLVKPNLAVSLRGPSAYQRQVQRQLDTILPGDSIAYPFIWPDSLLAGRYHVHVRATGGSQPVTTDADVTLGTTLHGNKNTSLPARSQTPWLLIAAVALLVIVAGVGLWLWRRRRGSGRDPFDDPPLPTDGWAEAQPPTPPRVPVGAAATSAEPDIQPIRWTSDAPAR
jgi:Bacterial protein of unknown function (DUF916)